MGTSFIILFQRTLEKKERRNNRKRVVGLRLTCGIVSICRFCLQMNDVAPYFLSSSAALFSHLLRHGGCHEAVGQGVVVFHVSFVFFKRFP